MNLFDTIIEQISGMTGAGSPKRYSYNPAKSWEETGEFELILQKEMAYELGGNGKQAVNCTCVTTTEGFVDGDEILLYGPDLSEIKDSASYARIAILFTDEISEEGSTDTEKAFRSIQAMDFVKYRLFPKGFMVRASGQTNREQVRISKKAIKNGISFERIGNCFINKYKQNKTVKSVKLIFITAEDADYNGLLKAAGKVTEITQSLSQIIKGLPTECGTCGLREICDEVEGLRELHFGNKNKK